MKFKVLYVIIKDCLVYIKHIHLKLTILLWELFVSIQINIKGT